MAFKHIICITKDEHGHLQVRVDDMEAVCNTDEALGVVASALYRRAGRPPYVKTVVERACEDISREARKDGTASIFPPLEQEDPE